MAENNKISAKARLDRAIDLKCRGLTDREISDRMREEGYSARGFIGEHYAEQGKVPILMVTSNPQFLHIKIPNWIITRIGHNSRHTMRQLKGAGSRDRITISLRYKPPRKSDQNLITLPPHPE